MRRTTIVYGSSGPNLSPRGIVIRLLGTAVGLWLASVLIPGIEVDDWQSLVAGTAVLSIVNMLVRPLAATLSCCLILLTFGLFLVVINAGMLALTAWMAGQLDLNLRVDGFWSALGGAVVISIASLIVTALTRPIRFGR